MRLATTPVRAAFIALLGLATAAPAAAVPASLLPAPVKAEPARAAENVQYNRSWDANRGFHRRGNTYYYNGHRGYRTYRHGWRRHNGWWFPPAAFALGAIVGSQYYRPAPRYYYRPVPRHGLSRAHYRWCEARYRTYRAWDNTYVPRVGVRAQCRSPYWR